MLLRNPFSNTKNFFRKTLRSFKSFFNIGCEVEPYQKLPKSSSPYTNPMNPQDLEKFYAEFTQTWDSNNAKTKKRNKKNGAMKMMASTQCTTQRRDDDVAGESKTKSGGNVEKREEGNSCWRNFSVGQKLKEIEMMDVSNVDHVLDIEEVLHYYSRLTCPAYIHVVDKFFMDICTEFLGPSGSPTSVGSRPKFRLLRH
ncbi:hypothetical protein F3Y22_tig00109987pilonHSYRG00034 [Hibiscus syriacus]|uniref:Uncharacterized protein n=1 Tax=Hibiscus syriacus TaxID=106335 RepID=A0A6A3BS00_HIBSY|nr:hypothetical protein F3Y22_tig00109987pilonHSYRG00034 [Hibiscus syriacus]